MTASNTKDPAFKLFGMKIPLPADDEYPPIPGEDLSPSMDREEEVEKTEKDCPLPQVPDTDQEDDASPRDTKESVDHDSLAETNVNPKTPSISEESAKLKASETEKEQNDATDSQEKPLKKPDKILPCPRCNSMDTKFCYYNNYNVSQPRHFCKACQRYWTEGGTMRNVPVGAGRRKNKNSSSHYHHITISEALQAAQVEAPNGMHHPALKANGGVLSFGLDAPICDSMATVLNLADKKSSNEIRNSFHIIEEQRILVPYRFGENGDDCSSSSSVTFANSVDDGGRACPQEHVAKSMNGLASPIPYVHGVPWPYPWNSAMPPHHFFPPGYPMTLFPAAAYWNCGNPGAWYMPLPSPQSSSSSNQKAISSGPDSPTLGKHSRDDDTLKPDGLSNDEKSKYKNGCVLVPKTLRIDDPTDAAKSSIWRTLGINNETFSGGKMFKAFESKSAEKNHTAEISPALWANPAALSRSITFHESS